MAFTKVDLDVDIFMDITLGMRVDGNRREWVLKFKKSLYGINQASENWYDPLNNGLKITGYHQSQVDPCVFYRKYSVILTYIDYCVIVPHKQYTIT